MPANTESQKIEQLMAEADELLQKIDSDVFRDMEEEHRLQVEIHAQKLKEIKSGIQSGIVKKKAAKKNAGAEGTHEAILDIVKAMGSLKKYLS